jgi:hypothetical protein
VICPICKKEGTKSTVMYLRPLGHAGMNLLYFNPRWDENGIPLPDPEPETPVVGYYRCSLGHEFSV